MHARNGVDRKRKRVLDEEPEIVLPELRPTKVSKNDATDDHGPHDTQPTRHGLSIITDPDTLVRMHADRTDVTADDLGSPVPLASDGSLDSLFDECSTSQPSSHPAMVDTSLGSFQRPALQGGGASSPSIFSDLDSLFDGPSTLSTNTSSEPFSSHQSSCDVSVALTPAQRSAPCIPGLFFDPALRLPDELAAKVMAACMRTYFEGTDANQIMLFERAGSSTAMSPLGSSVLGTASTSGLPHFLTSLLGTLSELLRTLLPPTTHALLFPAPGTQKWARQAIVNLYHPGAGIAPHVDLLGRFGDGIVGVSLGAGCAMRFERVRCGASGGTVLRESTSEGKVREDDDDDDDACAVYLPEGSVIVLSEEARYEWTHGIQKRTEDLVEDEDRRGCSWIPRGTRLSITFRWLLPGADVVGGPAVSAACDTVDGL
ncbi:hypothetical protein OBBRIDRAFT_789174 [Obba rivulosa]|uniref:Fe2OG dioxygenase domain-containing protein n=1 Tax=Obba rivulosa TaxID=1052685 RepID=A0A8E2DRK7_9APHY|nr:hypothetical protein OBBRIDRAFT_789174 [Obba rivulosa]